MNLRLHGFEYRRVPVSDGVELSVAVAGSGPAIALLHGFPQTHLMWRHVAADLANDHTVICPDLRGYGDSDKPEESSEDTYSKRTMAADTVEVARSLGLREFAIAGHDRGRWSHSAPDWTTPTRSRTCCPWTSCRRWTCGTSCGAQMPRWRGTCT